MQYKSYLWFLSNKSKIICALNNNGSRALHKGYYLVLHKHSIAKRWNKDSIDYGTSLSVRLCSLSHNISIYVDVTLFTVLDFLWCILETLRARCRIASAHTGKIWVHDLVSAECWDILLLSASSCTASLASHCDHGHGHQFCADRQLDATHAWQ